MDLDELQADLRTLERIAGLHVGTLDPDELRVFNTAVEEGRAYREYSSVAAQLVGIAKVGLVRQEVR